MSSAALIIRLRRDMWKLEEIYSVPDKLDSIPHILSINKNHKNVKKLIFYPSCSHRHHVCHDKHLDCRSHMMSQTSYMCLAIHLGFTLLVKASKVLISLNDRQISSIPRKFARDTLEFVVKPLKRR